MKRLAKAATFCFALGLIVGMMGCAPTGPKMVGLMAGAGDQIKLIYSQATPDGLKQGVVRCEMGADGALSNCKEIEIVLNGEE